MSNSDVYPRRSGPGDSTYTLGVDPDNRLQSYSRPQDESPPLFLSWSLPSLLSSLLVSGLMSLFLLYGPSPPHTPTGSRGVASSNYSVREESLLPVRTTVETRSPYLKDLKSKEFPFHFYYCE